MKAMEAGQTMIILEKDFQTDYGYLRKGREWPVYIEEDGTATLKYKSRYNDTVYTITLNEEDYKIKGT